MRRGNYIRALGQQCFEPSQPSPSPSDENLSASEESQARQGELVKAQNDVLATIGVCSREIKQLDKSELVVAENEAGYLVEAADGAVNYLASWPLMGLRNRLQTYQSYEGMRYRDVFRLAWRNQTLSQTFAGIRADICYEAVKLTREHFGVKFLVWLSQKSMFMDPVTRVPKNRGWLRWLTRIFTFSGQFLTFPLYYHSGLQALHLLPPSPALPSLSSLIPFSAASPLSLPRLSGPLFSRSSLITIATHVSTSYFLWSYAYDGIWQMVRWYLDRQLMRILPKPEPRARFLGFGGDDTFDQYDAALRARQDAPSPDTHRAEDPGVTAIVIEEVGHGSGGTTLSASVRIDPHSGEPSQSMGSVVEESDALEIDATANVAEPALPAPTLPPPPPPPPPSSSTQTRPQNRELQEREVQQPTSRKNAYKNTALSKRPVEVAASHLSFGLTTLATLWLEGAVQRLLARTFLLGMGMAEWKIQELVYAPLEIPANCILVAEAIIVGEMGLMWTLFEVTYGACSFIGVKWFGYLHRV